MNNNGRGEMGIPLSLQIAYSIHSLLKGNDDAITDLISLLDIKRSEVVDAK